ncbi:hypothetical protein IGI04_032989 [Brassica rapa subsp. trilocularis]|uniref:Uncharacterized protein n=2 Tax=Brassica TaxID=3705 RepID=A0ABQ7L4J9_BRACM|nr:hypothetical protein IGI04_032989 [Brassica rapa subsp. trilocularis]CAF2034675.1 unnamed protein product [Brassica napus]
MKKTTQTSFFLLRLLLLICLVFQVCVTEARFRHLGEERTFDTPSRSPKAKGGRRMSYGGT